MIIDAHLSDPTEERLVGVEPPGMNDIELVGGDDAGNRAGGDESKALLLQFVEAARRDIARYPGAAKPHVGLATALANVGMQDEAVVELQLALEVDPTSFVAKYSLARLLVRQGNLMQARRLLEEARQERPRDVEPLLGLASIALQSNDLQTARHLSELATEMSSMPADAYWLLGLVLLRQQQVDRAIGAYKAAVRHDSRSAVSYYALGISYAIKGDTKRATRSLQTCLAIAPSMGEAVGVLSRLLLHRGSPDGVIALLKERLEQDAADYEARHLLAMGYLSKGNYLEARRHLNRAYDGLANAESVSKPLLSRVANNLGVCYEKGGDAQNAEHYYWLATHHCPECGPLPFQNLVRFRINQGQLNEAEAALIEAEDRYPETPRLQFLRALLVYEREEIDAAIIHLETLIGQPGADENAYALLIGIMSEDRSDFDAALRLLTEYEGKFGRTVALANQLAYTHLMAGNTAAAGLVLAEEYEGETESVEMMATRGLYRLRSGDIEGGEAGYRHAAELARRQNKAQLHNLALQKMHLELAKSFVERGRLNEAQEQVRLGLRSPVDRGSYFRELKRLRLHLRVGTSS